MKNHYCKLLMLFFGSLLTVNIWAFCLPYDLLDTGCSWNRHIYNRSTEPFVVGVENSVKGNYRIYCDGIEYLNPRNGVVIQPGQTCQTKMTTTNNIHNTYLYFHRQDESTAIKLNLDSNRNLYWTYTSNVVAFQYFYGDIYEQGMIISASLLVDAYELPIFKDGKPEGPYVGGDILFYDNYPIATDIDYYNHINISGDEVYIEMMPVTSNITHTAYIYNFVPEPITLEGTDLKDGKISVQTGVNQITQFAKYGTGKTNPFTIRAAVIGSEKNWLPGVAPINYLQYGQENALPLSATIFFTDASTGKIITHDIINFRINAASFDYTIKAKNGELQKIRVLPNMQPTDDGKLIPVDGNMVICPVGFTKFSQCL